jgi:hypothetical protein
MKNHTRLKKYILAASLMLLAVSCHKAAKNDPNQGKNQAPSQVYTGQITTGFEGYFTNTTYSFKYNPAEFIIEIQPQQSNLVHIRDLQSGAVHVMEIFNNDGAGFQNSQDAWNNLKLCTDCKKINNNTSIKDSTGMLTFENDKSEWIIFQHDPGFVIFQMVKPFDKVKSVVESLTLKTSKTTPQ